MTKTKTPDVAVTFLDANGEECAIDGAPVAMQITFADGGVDIVTDHELQPVARACMWHGAKQKLVDATAIGRNPETGRSATVADKRAALVAVRDNLIAGEWFKQRDGAPSGGLLLRALCMVYEGRKIREELVEYLSGKSLAEQAALRKVPKIADAITEIRAASAKAGGIDGEELLGELDD